MKHLLSILYRFSFVAMACFSTILTPLFAQTGWEKYEHNPVLDVGDGFDSNIFFQSILRDGDGYKMYFTGIPGYFGLATSTDGINWEKSLFNPILTANDPGFEGLGVLPYVRKHNDIYRMWFIARAADGVKVHVRYATSNDGIQWTAHESNPVLAPGAAGDWDDTIVNVGSVMIENDSTYHMWYAGRNSTPGGYQIGYASSSDGINWTKHPNNPLLSPGTPGEWDDEFIILPEVVYHNNMYNMIYVGNGGGSGGDGLGYATSPDGITWTKYEDNPVLAPGEIDSWEATGVSMGRVMFAADTCKLWYAGRDAANIWRIGYATQDHLTSIGDDRAVNFPEEFSLAQNYPNPFNPETTIEFALKKSGPVKLHIFNLQGQEIRILTNRTYQAGQHRLRWDGRDQSGNQVASGVYFYQLKFERAIQTKKMLLLR